MTRQKIQYNNELNKGFHFDNELLQKLYTSLENLKTDLDIKAQEHILYIKELKALLEEDMLFISTLSKIGNITTALQMGETPTRQSVNVSSSGKLPIQTSIFEIKTVKKEEPVKLEISDLKIELIQGLPKIIMAKLLDFARENKISTIGELVSFSAHQLRLESLLSNDELTEVKRILKTYSLEFKDRRKKEHRIYI
jgi:hypothetical protein